MLLLFISLLAVSAASEAPYICDKELARTKPKAGCFNMYIMPGNSNYVALSDDSLDAASCELVISCQDRSLQWLVLQNPRCKVLLANLSASMPSSTVTDLGTHALVCDDAARLAALDMALVDCDKQHLKCRDVWTDRAKENLPLFPKGVVAQDSEKDLYLASVKELGEDGRFNSLLSQLSGAAPMPLGEKGSVTINTRYTMTNENTLAAEFISQSFTSHEADDVSDQAFNMPDGTPTVNVIAAHYGTTNPDEVVVVGAHFDSTSPSANRKKLAPGAVDNGSGTVGALLLGESLKFGKFDRTVHIVAFSGEEQGLYGSAHYVQQAQKQGLNIVGALIMDMISYSNKHYGVTIEGTSNKQIQELMNRTEANMNTYAPKLDVNLSPDSFGSDHVSFQRAGIPAVLAIELDDTNYHSYHRTSDTVDHSNGDQGLDIVLGLAGTLYDLAKSGAAVVKKDVLI